MLSRLLLFILCMFPFCPRRRRHHPSILWFSLLCTAAIVLLALGVLTPVFRFIPMAALSAIIITAVLGMVNLRIVAVLWRVKGIDMLMMMQSMYTLYQGVVKYLLPALDTP